MQLKKAILICAGIFLLVLGSSSSYAEDPPSVAASQETPSVAASQDAPTASASPTRAPSASASPKAMSATAMASNPPTLSSPQAVYLVKENPFFGLHIEKAVDHARAAEIAGNQRQAAELLEHAKMSLMQAQEAQRAGNVPHLNEGINNLREALRLPIVLTQASTQTSSAEVPQASMQTSSAEVPQASMQTSSAEVPQASMQTSPAPQVTGEKALSGTQREASAIREATNSVREARKHLSQAGGMKYVELKPQPSVAVAEK